MMTCPVCGRRASAMTTLRSRAGAVAVEAERYVHERDACITAWRPVATAKG